MGVECVQHSRDGPVVDCLVRVDGFGVVVLDDRVDVRELFQTVFDVRVARERRLLPCALSEQNPQKTTRQEKEKYEEERPARTTCHLEFFLRLRVVEPPQLLR